MSIVSNNIKYLRRLNGLTQEQFARKIGIKRSLLGAYEEARANPNLTNLKNMAQAFGISVDQLLKNDLRKIRETPNLGLPMNGAVGQNPPPPLMADPTPPQPLAAIIDKYQRPRPTLRMVSRQITLKPVHQRGTFQPGTPPHSVAQQSVAQQGGLHHGVAKNSQEPAPSVQASYLPPRFNSQYDGGTSANGTSRPEEHLFSQQSIQLVRNSQTTDYLTNYQNSTFLTRLPQFQLPNLPSGNYRAFEAGEDFAFPGALLVGTYIRNWYDIKDGANYIFVLRNQGIVYRRAYNQVKIKGIVLLSSDIASVSSTEVSIKEVLEVWEVKAFVSLQLPEPSLSIDRVRELVEELRHELDRNPSF
ncbi:helix-turn-helix transcriptional regulator [Telluribacter sp.]|jgi:transcriptional regulator with XRE-family HTH domain|uniref:helix-turn-helix transcriptional regulator n=1 Tax=Telluribacter sp. TaxID=1978767 RepID=UPI002E133748|nr:helix-turn-helix transcriptional regulator [Telluribacter sp.]